MTEVASPESVALHLQCDFVQVRNLGCAVELALAFYNIDSRIETRQSRIRNRGSLLNITFRYNPTIDIQSNFNGSNTFGTMKISLRQG